MHKCDNISPIYFCLDVSDISSLALYFQRCFKCSLLAIKAAANDVSTALYCHFNADYWLFNRPLFAFLPPTIGVSTAHYWRLNRPVDVLTAHDWRFKHPLSVSTAHYWRFSNAHYWRFNRPLGVSTAHYWRFKRPLLAFQTPTFLAPILVSTPLQIFQLGYKQNSCS